ncbi:MAG: bifunctional metallophosphatase/5'-nucleotidase [Spirochaetaceae bacterium]|nr:bifunctional metallophosphatase/5'-nucleotidase [Spirochaetaceae bacterium]
MKRFSIFKLSSVMLSILLLMTFISCKTTAKITKENLGSISSVEQTFIEVEQPAVIDNLSIAILPVEKKEVQYPLGIKPIIKNDNGDTLFDLILVHTNDVNSNIYSSEHSIGYARLSTLIKEGKKVSQNILVLDAGNNTSAIPLVKLTTDSLTSSLLNLTGYDVVAPTLNDYENGVNLMAKKNSYKLLAANVLDSNGYLVFQPYQIFQFNEFKVCVIGLAAPFGVNGDTYKSDLVIKNAQSSIDIAHQYSDFVIVLGNMKDNNITGIGAKEICQNLNGIDLFIDGESSIISGSTINGTTIVSAKANMASVGVFDLLIENNKVVSLIPFEITANDVNNPKESKLASKYNIVSVAEDNKVTSYLEKEENSISKSLNKVVGKLNYTLTNLDIGMKQTNMSKLLCSATTSMIAVDATILPASTFRSSLQSGDVTYKDILLALTPNDSVVVIKLSGEELYSLFEDGYKDLSGDSSAYILSDLKIIYNRFAKVGARILRVKLNNKNIDKSAIINIATTKEYANKYGFNMIEMNNFQTLHLSDILIDNLNK